MMEGRPSARSTKTITASQLPLLLYCPYRCSCRHLSATRRSSRDSQKQLERPFACLMLHLCVLSYI